MKKASLRNIGFELHSYTTIFLKCVVQHNFFQCACNLCNCVTQSQLLKNVSITPSMLSIGVKFKNQSYTGELCNLL